MIDAVQAVWLAAIQGLTEFLPISSSAHLILMPRLFDWPEQGIAFDVAVHLGTLLAIVGYLRKDLYAIIGGWFSQWGMAGATSQSRLGLVAHHCNDTGDRCWVADQQAGWHNA